MEKVTLISVAIGADARHNAIKCDTNCKCVSQSWRFMEPGNARNMVSGINGTFGMFGVVLWSDQKDRKAVIWCEDHGDLAFCSESVDDQGGILDTGDLIQFDVTLDRHMRLAQNPRKISEGAYEGLADTLRMMPPEPPAKAMDQTAEVIPFDRIRLRRDREEIRLRERA